ncbi:MAG TPA: sulfite exporter TauE/SafE family protein [Candidatus Aquilonibacter sp.]|nr:sulfite exporter TauE/SafE family protein [Candidatus Aquilonibacter sp.]
MTEGSKTCSNETEQHFRYWSWWLLLFVAVWTAVYFGLAHDPVGLFRRNWIYIPVGFCGAVLGNISAVGGGIVFIPVIMFLFQLPPVTALKIALASQSWGMTSGAIGWIQKRVVPLRALKLTVPGLLIGSSISSLVIHPNALLVKLLFGPVSILLGVLTVVLSRRAGKTAALNQIPPNASIPLFVISLIGGLITGWIAIGEGELVAALLMLVYGVNVTTCIGLGVLLLSINSIFLTLIHQFLLNGIPWNIAAFTGLGCVFGARLAPYLSRRSNPMVLKTIFAVIAICDGILFIIQYAILHRAD